MRKFGFGRRLALLGRRGATALEFALVAGVLFVTMLAVIDMSRYYMTMMSAREAVAQTARAMMINPSLTPLDARTCNTNALINAAGGLGFVRSTGRLCVTITRPVAGDNSLYQARVELDAPFNFLIRVFGLGTVTIVEDQSFRFAA